MARVCPEIEGFDPDGARMIPRVQSTAERRAERRQEVADQARALMRLWISRDDLTLRKVADELHVTPRHLQRVFHSLGSEGFRAERDRIRMSWAADQLAGGRAVGEVSRLVGYRGSMHFAKAFRRAYGCSPREWRELATERP